MNRKMIKLMLVTSMFTMAGSAMAAIDTANLVVNATVLTNCAIGAGVIEFGPALQIVTNKGLGTLGSTANVDADSGTTISVICTNGSSATITANAGVNPSNVIGGADRAMKNSVTTDYLSYDLYTASARTTKLSTVNSIAYTGTGLATATTTIYGRISGANLAVAKAGTYTDTVAMTITYLP
ncbi:MAG: spore coat protein U domain-containing protein [Polaromonas sp.]|nr:spore coat protein U domain-containing protein [Polaromonas sp.]